MVIIFIIISFSSLYHFIITGVFHPDDYRYENISRQGKMRVT